jgi:O-acetylhomoserine/O-acetylserine sulfhydrylase-like pyridoxal-dependent enzyme
VCSNPLLRITDLEKVVEVVKGFNKDIMIAIDNTFLTPFIVVIQPFLSCIYTGKLCCKNARKNNAIVTLF